MPIQSARLMSLATAVPPYILKQNEVTRVVNELFLRQDRSFARYLPVFENAQIDTRYSSVPIEWYTENHSYKEKNDIYIESATGLLKKATMKCLEKENIDIQTIDHIVMISSTGVSTPSLEARLMNQLPFRADVQRTPIFGLGCAGGVIGLGRAARLAEASPGSRVLLLVVELCGLTFQNEDISKRNLIATALFGDGAAAAVISTDGNGPQLLEEVEHTWPDSLGIMGWDVDDRGLSVIFSQSIPKLVVEKMSDVIAQFCDRISVPLEKFDGYVPHPGGAKVIDALETIFKLEPGQLVDSRDILRRYGNMSAATVLFVLEKQLQHATANKQYLLTTLGPGFTAALMRIKT